MHRILFTDDEYATMKMKQVEEEEKYIEKKNDSEQTNRRQRKADCGSTESKLRNLLWRCFSNVLSNLQKPFDQQRVRTQEKQKKKEENNDNNNHNNNNSNSGETYKNKNK